ncbi:MAG: RNA polymerase sigma factor [candidate division KSB1 bacterium]|nr:RNA polymerase sigma factor [candidate division KSB1 bacterium]
MTDQEIIREVKGGNIDAYTEFVKRHESRVAATVYGMLGNCAEAEDVGQETFIRFYKNIGNFRGDADPLTYLTRIAINLSLNEIKRRKRSRLTSIHKAGDEVLQIEDTDVRQFDDTGEVVQNAINRLNAKYRSVVVLRMIEGHTTVQTAEILQIPVGTVLSRLARAQDKLKKILQPYQGELI